MDGLALELSRIDIREDVGAHPVVELGRDLLELQLVGELVEGHGAGHIGAVRCR